MEHLKKLHEEGAYVTITKLSQKREGMINSGYTHRGPFTLGEYSDGTTYARVGRGINTMSTSPILKELDVTEDSVTFETEGGVYKVQKLKET